MTSFQTSRLLQGKSFEVLASLEHMIAEDGEVEELHFVEVVSNKTFCY